jgi:hypothetical protein
MVEWIRRCLQMLLRKVQIDRRVREIRMTEQHLNRANVRACFEQMGGIAVAQGVLVLLMICTPRRSAIDITRSMEQQSSWFDTYGGAVRR